MLVLMKTEFWKLKRYHMVWAGVFLMLLSVLLTVFSTTAQDGSVWTFSFFVEQVLKNNITTIFPMCIALITGYIISREGTDDTLKNILTVPLSFPALLAGKLAVCGLLSLFLGIVSTVFTVTASSLLGFPGGDLLSVMQTGLQITANCLFLYWSGCRLCLRLRRDVRGREHDLGEFVSRDRKHGADWIPQL